MEDGEAGVRIDEVPMICKQCRFEAPINECNCDDPIGDGAIGCPQPDCGGEMVMDTRKVDTSVRPYRLKCA